MCRYAFRVYKPHYACFACRKAFKRRFKREVRAWGRVKPVVDPNDPDVPAKCPGCGLLMADMGLDFKAPPQADAKAWSVAESLWVIGFTFHSCGCGGPGYRPRRARDYEAFLRKTVADYQEALRRWLDEAPSSPTRAGVRDEGIATWRERIQRVEEALAALPGERGKRKAPTREGSRGAAAAPRGRRVEGR
jgi:hypothetical protein